jgi:hypothetical protein
MSLKTTLFAATAAVIALTSAAQAKDGPAVPALLPPAVILNQMVADGHDLRALDWKNGRYVATVRAPSGQMAALSVDPRSGELLPVPAKLGRDVTPEIGTNAVAALVAAAGQGHWDLQELKWVHGAYVVEARDDLGTIGQIRVNPVSGEVVQTAHR